MVQGISAGMRRSGYAGVMRARTRLVVQQPRHRRRRRKVRLINPQCCPLALAGMPTSWSAVSSSTRIGPSSGSLPDTGFRVEPQVTRTAPPQIRTSATNTSGSSLSRFRCVDRVDNLDRWESVPLYEAGKPIPGHVGRRPRPPMEPFLPQFLDPFPIFAQPQVVTRDAVVSKVTANFLAQLPMLLRNRPMPVVATPLGDSFQ